MPAFFHSMHGRLFLILLVGIIVTAAGTMLLTHARQQEIYDRVRGQHLAAEIADLVDMLQRTPAPQREAFLNEPHGMGIRAHLNEAAMPPFAAHDAVLEEALRQRLDGASVAATLPSYEACGNEPIRRFRHAIAPPQCQRVQLTLADGSTLALIAPLPPMRQQGYPPPV